MNLVIIKNIFVLIVAGLHFYFLVLEMFLWTKPKGRKVFGMSAERAESTAVLAANQGLYNGFLAAGLIWSIWAKDPEFSFQLSVFFLSCVILAAIYGGYSVSKKILLVQGVPALLALILVLLG